VATSIPPDLLERIWFYTNFDCHLRCSYCVAGLAPGVARPRLELPVFRRLVDQAVTLGFRQIALTGGEPLLHPDVVAMIEYATDRIDTIVLTSALPLTAALLRELSRVDRSRLTVQVSLDSADPGVNDRRRGLGSWLQATCGLEMLLGAGYRVAVRATLALTGEEILPDLVRYLDTLGVPAERVYGAPVAKVGRAKQGLDLCTATIWPEPTILSDGLYWHPLLIDPSLVVTPQFEPLESSLQALVRMVDRVKPTRPKEVR